MMEATVGSPTAPRGAEGTGPHPALRWGDEHPLALGWGIAVILGIISGIVWPTIPSYDPFSWVVWGHAVTAANIPFYVGSGPSWKPLPFFFTTIYGLFGSAAPWLWVVTARIGGIAGLTAAVRLSILLCRRAGLPVWAGWLAGLVAIAGIVLSWSESLWSYYFFRGTSEVLLIGVWLWAIERFFSARHWQAYALLSLEGWMRPEAWPFLLVYGLYLVWKHPRMRIWVVLGLISQPVAWFVPPWISTGQPFMAASHASEYNGHLGSNWFVTVVERGESLQSLPTLVFAIIATGIGLWRGRTLIGALAPLWRRPTALLARVSAESSEVLLVLTLAGLSAGWWVVVIVETADHYPGLQRFYLPAAAMICVLSGYGLVRFALGLGILIGALTPTEPRRGQVVSVAGLLIAAIVCVGSWHWLSERWHWAREQEPLAAVAVTRIDDLGRSVRQLGGIGKILPCPSSVITINHSLQTAMAWELGTDLGKVKTMFAPGDSGLAWVGPRDSIDGGDPPILYHFTAHQIARVGDWSIQQVYPAGTRPGRCVGS